MLNFGNKEFRNLQEQVLKNAQDIETLKGRENLQVVIVEELPEVGNPNYIYLVPNNDEEESNVYDEYIWLAEAEEYERIGGVSIDMTNYVTLDSAQTISGAKTFSGTTTFTGDANFTNTKATGTITLNNDITISVGSDLNIVVNLVRTAKSIRPSWTEHYDLGTSGYKWNNGYFSGTIYASEIAANNFGVSGNNSYLKGDLFAPDTTGTKDLGTSSYYWRDLYMTGSLKDGVNTVSVANISTKTTSSAATGTFDSNGESTILNGASISEGLYIFTYGNCECIVRLTATMIQSSDVTPIKVACPMIVSGSPSLGWLHIAKSGSNLTISVKDSNDHVDSGFAWTLTKTNLL